MKMNPSSMEKESPSPSSKAWHEQHSMKTDYPPVSTPPSKGWMIALILVALIVIVGFLIYNKLSQPSNGNDNPLPYPLPVKVKLLIDSQCDFCLPKNTILYKFDEAQIRYDLETIDIHSAEGQSLIEEFNVNSVPTALISVTGLDQNSLIQRALQGLYQTMKNGYIVMPEAFLDKQPHIIEFITPPNACVVPEGKVTIEAFLDYSCKPCAQAQFVLEQLESDYNNLIVRRIPTQYRRTTQSATDKATLSTFGALCAQQQGYLDPYSSCHFLNVQFNEYQDLNSMRICLREAGARNISNANQFTSCVTDQNESLKQNILENIQEGINWRAPFYWTPAFIVDCKYTFIGHNSLRNFICYLHEELPGCAEIKAQIDSNSLSTNLVPDRNQPNLADQNAPLDQNQ